jgi:putative transposase
MIAFFATLLRVFLQAFRSKGNILTENAVLKKENEILQRKMGKKRVQFGFYDKVFLVVLSRTGDIKHRLTLVKPETVLSWQRTLINRFWTFEHSPAKRGRKAVDADIKKLILSMKNYNLLWVVKRIQGELLKLDISLSTKTIRKILQGFRRRGKIRKSLTWKRFLETQIQSIYAMDFLTVDTVLGKRLYIFAVISHKTREIVKFAITGNPTREFVRQELTLFKETIADKVYLIHDNALMFNIDFIAFNLGSVRTGVEAPNMNSIMERFFRSVRREALDNLLLIGRSQIETILEEYVEFYNGKRAHQGLQQQIPNPVESEKTRGAIGKSAVLGGLHHHYYRRAA